MAVRFGGPHSPGQQKGQVVAADADRALRRMERRTSWVIVAAAPLLVGAFFHEPAGMALHLAGFAMVAAGMQITRQGLRAAAAYEARTVARRPALPRKLLGGLVMAAGLAIGAARPEIGALPGAAVIGVVAMVLHRLCFGADPRQDKGMDEVDGLQMDRATRFINEGEARLAEMDRAIARLRDPALSARMARFSDTARRLFRRVGDNPASLAAARRYLGVYLSGARDATVKFVALQAEAPDPAAAASWSALMGDLETNFAARSEELMAGGRTDMEIEVSVLRERLAQEGVRVAAEPVDPDDAAAAGAGAVADAGQAPGPGGAGGGSDRA